MLSLYKQIWLADLISHDFLELDWFLPHGKNYDPFVENDQINFQHKGALPDVVVNPLANSLYPLAISQRTDTPDFVELDNFATKPTRIYALETISLSYDKRQSVLQDHRNALIEAVGANGMWNISPTANKASTPIIQTDNGNTNGEAYKLITKNEIHKLRVALNKKYKTKRMDVPWVLVMDTESFWGMVNNDENLQTQYREQGSEGNVSGAFFKYYGFEIHEDNRTAWYSDVDTKLAYGSNIVQGTHLPSCIAYVKDKTFYTARGTVDMFGQEKEPTFQADVYSFLLRAKVDLFGKNAASNQEEWSGAILRTPNA